MTLVGVVSAILLAAGLIPPYFEIAKRSGRVVGISMCSSAHSLKMGRLIEDDRLHFPVH